MKMTPPGATLRSILSIAPEFSGGLIRSLATLAIAASLTTPGRADETRNVPGTANIYGAGHSSPPPAGFGGSGELPPGITFAAAAGQTLEIVSATGAVTLDQVTNNAGLGPNGPDGGSFYSPTDVTSIGGLSGIKSTVTGFLTGVFLDGTEPAGAGPTVLDFTASGLGTNFNTLTPLIGQVFFIGDGRTSTGGVQRFQIPATATRLFLGIVDAADGDNVAGPPQAYGDNGGSFSATVRIDSKITRIVYSRNGDLISMDAAGGNKQNLTSGSYFTEIAELSADGNFVAFRGTRAAPAPGGSYLSGIWVMKAEPVGAENVPVLVSSNLNYGYNLSWHPDGRHLALGEYVTTSPMVPVVTVLRVRDSGGTITPEGAGNVAVRMTLRSNDLYYSGGNFSPDGRYLAMSNKGKQVFLLRAFNSAGELTPESAANPLAKVGTLDAENAAGTPEWSPDARSVVFPQITSNAGNPVSRLAVLQVRDSSGTPIPENAGNPRINYTTPVAGAYTTVSPSWSADGSRIAYAWAADSVSFYNTYTILASAPENLTTNPKVMLTSNAEGGTLTPSFAQARILVGDTVTNYSVALSGLKNGQLLPPKTNISLRANINPSSRAGLTIQKVQFFLNGNPTGAADTTSPYTYSSLVESAGERTITAVATDSLGGTVTSAPLKFIVTPAGAGQLALQTEIIPAGTTFAPGQLVTYRLLATNTSKTATAKGVKLVTPVPERTKFNRAIAYDENGAKLSPSPKVSENKKEVAFTLGDIPVGKTRRAELTVRVPYDAEAGGDSIRNTRFNITGIGFGDQPFSGNFAVLSRQIAGAPPANSPRLSMIKTIVDLADDKNDELDMIEDPKLGSIPGAGPGDVLSFLLVISNYGGLPAERVSITDRIPLGCKLVPKSVRVNDVSAGALLQVNGRTLNFQLGDLPANKIVVVSYQLAILDSTTDAPTPGVTLYSVGAEVGAMNLEGRSDSAPERLPIRIEKPVEIRVSHVAKTGTSEVGKPTTYALSYRNEGNRIARGAQIVNPIPEGTKYRPGSAVIRNKKPGQSIDTSNPNLITFNLGDVPSESGGLVELAVDVKKTVLGLTPLPHVVNRPYIGGGAATSADGPNRTSAAPAPGAKGFIPEDRNPVSDPSIPRLFIARIAPQSVQKGGRFNYQIIIGNSSDLEVGGAGGISFEIPKGAKYLSSSAGIYSASANKFFASYHHFTGNPAVKLPAHSAKGITVLLEATGAVGDVINDSTCYLSSKNLLQTYVPAAATLIIDGSADSSTNQVRIASVQLSALGLDSSVAMLDDRVASAVGNINAKSISTRIGGTSYVQMTNGSTLVPLLGDDRILAIGPADLIGNDGSTLIGNDGSTLVAAGGGNLITFNGLIGNDGSTLVGQDGGTIMSKLRTNDPANLVAAGGGNLVAAGGGNLVGNDGASLVGNDRASFATIASFLTGPNPANLVAAGGGNFLGSGGRGLIFAAAASVTINNPEALVAAGGGNLVAAGGGNLVGNDGASVSLDKSLAVAYNKNGSLTVGGGGSPVAAK